MVKTIQLLASVPALNKVISAPGASSNSLNATTSSQKSTKEKKPVLGFNSPKKIDKSRSKRGKKSPSSNQS